MNRNQLDKLSILVVAVAAAVAAYSLLREQPLGTPGSQGHPAFYENTFTPVDSVEGDAELERLHRRFGEKFYSWHYEEWFVRDFFDDMRDGFFVDVGSWHYSYGSNTFLLEINNQWSGIAIEAQERFRADYDKNRPCTKFFNYFVSDKSTGQTELFVSEANTAVASSDMGHIDRHSLEITEALQVQEITLDDLLDREGVKRIDFLSMDIELAEPAALSGFDIERFAPKLVCIEDNPRSRVHEFIEGYFEGSSGILVARERGSARRSGSRWR